MVRNLKLRVERKMNNRQSKWNQRRLQTKILKKNNRRNRNTQ